MAMKRYKECNRKKKAVSGIIAGIILFAIIFTTGAAYFMFVQYSYQLQHVAAAERAEMEIDQSSEQFLVTGKLTATNTIGVSVNNTGSIPITVANIFVSDDDGTLYEFMDEEDTNLPFVVNSGKESGLVDTGVYYIADTQFVIKVVTERGNTELGLYPPIHDVNWYKSVIAEIAKGVGSLVLDIPKFSFRFYYAEPANKCPLGSLQQNGYLLGGYPAFSLPGTTAVIFAADIMNADPDGRDILLKQNSLVSLGGSPGSYIYYICKSVTFSPNPTITPLSKDDSILIPWGEIVTLYFSPNSPGGSVPPTGGPPVDKPWGVILLLYGGYSDTRPYAQTIPVVATYTTAAIIENMNATGGYTGAQVEVTGKSGWKAGSVTVGWMKTDGTVLTVGSGTATGSTMEATFIIPDIAPGYYAIYVSDGINTAFATFYHAGAPPP
ncbi:MAG: hypothetical protein H3Z50_06280 [archaeon]|nr:hypothetical protein [archaeon]